MPRTSADIRREFIDFFVKQHAHTFVPSSSVVPHDDPTLLFTNAGMNQFKPCFLGTQKAPWPRVANSQKCIRAGGKHNDLDDVGRSRRHHTFFEMLGNWSFGDYFKQGAIEMAWELLTKVWSLDPRTLHVSCYEGSAGVPRDEQAADIWRKVANWEQYGQKSSDHIHYFGKDNFWEMGDTGPCGPCTEIYIDRRPEVEIHTEIAAGRRAPVNGNDPRVMEVWNLVFIQYDRDAGGKLTTLPAQHVDTGMGLERLCQVLQDKEDNYATDLFRPLFESISQISNLKYTGQFPPTNAADPELEAKNPQLRIDIAFRVVADHLRCLTFALTDGATPSNEGRGYVLRRILRRAVRFGRQQLGLQEPFMHHLVPVVVDTMGEMFPELKKNPQRVADIIKDEELSFGRTLSRGILLFDLAASDAVGRAYARALGPNVLFAGREGGAYWEGEKGGEERVLSESASSLNFIDKTSDKLFTKDTAAALAELRQAGTPIDIAAQDAFKLYDTYGFPIDLTRIMAEERGMTVDLAGYEKLMEQAREKSKGGAKGAGDAVFDLPPTILDELQKLNVHPTDDSHKFSRAPARATIRAIWNGTSLEQSTDTTDTRPGEKIAIILDKTNFYSEMGGQIGDSGELRADSGAAPPQAPVGRPKGNALFIVETTRLVGHYALHIGHVKTGRLNVADSVTAFVMGGRDRTEKNHTATHLANWALRETLGEHVQQKGSLVDPEKLRFDFVHPKAMADDEISLVEKLVNECIGKKLPVYTEVAPQEQAMKIHGLRAVFGEKYPPMVRVVSIGVSLKDLLADPGNPKWQEYSIEFCGGTHLSTAADAERFAITSEESVSKGIRRLVALTGASARDAIAQGQLIENLIAQAKESPDASLPAQIAALQKSLTGANVPLLSKRRAQAAIADLQDRHKKWQRAQSDSVLSPQSSALPAAEALLASAEPINGISLIVARVPDSSPENLRNTWDWLKKKHPQQNLAVLLASEFTDTDKDGNKLPPKVNLLAAVGDPHIGKLKAGDWVKAVAPIVGGSGGGRPQLAMAGGKETAKIDEALAAARTFAKQKLG